MRNYTFVVGRRIVVIKMARIDILSVLNINSFIVTPINSESLAILGRSWLLIEFLHVIGIGRWLFFGISQDYLRYGLFVPLTERARFVLVCRAKVRLQYIRVVKLVISEAVLS